MSRYRKVEVRTWNDAKFRRLSRSQPCGQSLWFYLMTGSHTGPIPGLFQAGPAAMAEALKWEPKAFTKAFQEVLSEGMAKADTEACLVWLPNAVKHNKPANPNVVKMWGGEFELLPECRLRDEAYWSLESFICGLGPKFAEAFESSFAGSKPSRKPSRKPLQKPLANQEQEQEQEQERENARVISTEKTIAAAKQKERAQWDPLPHAPYRTPEDIEVLAKHRQGWGWHGAQRLRDDMRELIASLIVTGGPVTAEEAEQTRAIVAQRPPPHVNKWAFVLSDERRTLRAKSPEHGKIDLAAVEAENFALIQEITREVGRMGCSLSRRDCAKYISDGLDADAIKALFTRENTANG